MSFYINSYSGRGAIYVSGGRGEKSNFGNETIPYVACSGDATLNGTTVTGRVNVGGSLHAAQARAASMSADGSATIISSVCDWSINAKGSITCNSTNGQTLNAGGTISLTDAQFPGSVFAGGSVDAKRCKQLGQVFASGPVNLNECVHVHSVFSDNHVTLISVNVEADVIVNGTTTLKDSKIRGRLICSSNHLVIEGCTIDTIELRSSASISIDSGNFSNFQNRNEPAQIIELRNCTIRNIVFQTRNGEVVLSAGSTLTGAISGGKIRQQVSSSSSESAAAFVDQPQMRILQPKPRRPIILNRLALVEVED